MKKMKTLLIGSSPELMRPLPFLFFRAGFVVDVVSNFSLPKNKFISNAKIISGDCKMLEFLAQENFADYDLIVICDDWVLKIIRDSNLPLEKKLQLLPIQKEQDLAHIYSKIGLSQILTQNQITTPDFFVVKNFSDAHSAAQKLGFPLLLKLDQESGGRGVFECENFSDLAALEAKFFNSPFLLQKKINGVELDLSGFYRGGKLVNFTYSVIEKTLHKFAPSTLRTYYQLSEVEKSVFVEMEKLGAALGADGFVTISAIKSADDGKLYFFEADMRPNTWADHGRFIGEDFAPKISAYFFAGKTFQPPQTINKNHPKKLLIPLCGRMNFFEILCNRHNVWRFISRNDILWFCSPLLEEIKYFFWRINRLPTLTIRLFLPQKEQRRKVRFYFKKILRFSELSP